MRKTPRTHSTPSATAGYSLLESLLAHVAFDGWTDMAYQAACKEMGISRGEAGKLYPAGLGDLVEAFGDSADMAMQKSIDAERGFDRMRVRDKITFAVRARLEYLAPYREAMRRLMVWYAMPHHVPQAMKRIAKTVDLIWIAAGDNSTDYNRYTKRILLAGVMKATLLFWLSDDSKGQQATWDFLDRRIGDVMKLGKSISLLKEFRPAELAGMLRDKIRKAV